MKNLGKRLSQVKSKSKKLSTTKKVLWFVIINATLWVWDSHALAWYGISHPVEGGMVNALESLSEAIVTGILVTLVGYFLKALFEKRKDFGEVGKDEDYERTDEETFGESDLG